MPIKGLLLKGQAATSPAVKTVDSWIFWLVVSILSALLLALAVCFVLYICRQKRKNRGKSKKTADCMRKGSVLLSVGKLHEQGDRSGQQDCFAVSPQELLETNGVLAVVADGMGGLADGDKVSQAAVSAMFDHFLAFEGPKEELLLYLAEIANRTVNMLLGPAGMGKSGSTLVSGLFYEDCFYYLSIGDSRICLFRDGQLFQLNREHIFRHDLAIEAVNGRGSLRTASTHPQKSGLTSYLGMGALKYIDIPAEPIAILPGDTFVLMSDGVYNALTREELSTALALDAEEAAACMGQMIAQKAYQNQDNYTAVVLRYDRSAHQKEEKR